MKQALALFAASASASAPVYGTYPGWVLGENRVGINVEIVIDFMCSDSAANNPIWEATLASPWLDGTVQDQVYWAYSPLALPYHVHTWQVGQVLPYLQELCAEQNNCLMNDYKNFCFRRDILTFVEDAKFMSQDDFEILWSQVVATEFNLDQTTLLNLYKPLKDKSKSENNSRAMWKFNAARKVSGTPSAFINGVPVAMPASTEDWLTLLQQVYDSQYRA